METRLKTGFTGAGLLSNPGIESGPDPLVDLDGVGGRKLELFPDQTVSRPRVSPRERFADRVRERIPGVVGALGLAGERLDGRDFESLVETHFLRNPEVTERMLRQASGVRLEDLASSDKVRHRVLRCCPEHRQSREHRFTVGMVAALTGIEPRELSEATPDLGMLGSVRRNLYVRPFSERNRLTTALHDATDYLKGAGVKGLNKAVWGIDSTFWSAVASFIGGTP